MNCLFGGGSCGEKESKGSQIEIAGANKQKIQLLKQKIQQYMGNNKNVKLYLRQTPSSQKTITVTKYTPKNVKIIYDGEIELEQVDRVANEIMYAI